MDQEVMMKTFLAQNQFGASVPCADETAGSSPAPLRDPAVPLSVSGEGPRSGASLPGAEVVASVRTAAASDMTTEQTNYINEIFFYARKLIAEDRRFVLDEAAFMAAIDEVPLFLRAE